MERINIKKILPFMALAPLLALVFVLQHNFAVDATDIVVLNDISLVKIGAWVRIEVTASAPPRYQIIASPPTQIIIELKDTMVNAKKLLTIEAARVSAVRAEQKRTEPDYAVWVVVDLKAPTPFNHRLVGNTLVIEVQDEGGPVVALRPLPVVDLRQYFGNFKIVMDLHSDILHILFKTRTTLPFNQTEFQVTLPHLTQGGYNAQVFVVFVPPREGFYRANALLSIFNRLLVEYPDRLARAASIEDLKRNLEQGKISGFLGIEGGEAIEDDLQNLDYFYNQGVRYMGLVWNASNLIGDAALAENKPWHGLSPYGEKVVRRMNELGIIIDLAHATEETVADVLAISTKPVMDSHTGCYALNPHRRNLTDEEIKGICRSGGVIGVIFSSNFLTGRSVAYPTDVVNHIDHIVRLGGIGCVALGSDYDGGVRPPIGLEKPAGLPNLTRALRERGYRPEQIDLIYGLNFLRVLQAQTAN